MAYKRTYTIKVSEESQQHIKRNRMWLKLLGGVVIVLGFFIIIYALTLDRDGFSAILDELFSDSRIYGGIVGIGVGYTIWKFQSRAIPDTMNVTVSDEELLIEEYANGNLLKAYQYPWFNISKITEVNVPSLSASVLKIQIEKLTINIYDVSTFDEYKGLIRKLQEYIKSTTITDFPSLDSA
jgi:hypothetical protein